MTVVVGGLNAWQRGLATTKTRMGAYQGELCGKGEGLLAMSSFSAWRACFSFVARPPSDAAPLYDMVANTACCHGCPAHSNSACLRVPVCRDFLVLFCATLCTTAAYQEGWPRKPTRHRNPAHTHAHAYTTRQAKGVFLGSRAVLQSNEQGVRVRVHP